MPLGARARPSVCPRSTRGCPSVSGRPAPRYLVNHRPSGYHRNWGQALPPCPLLCAALWRLMWRWAPFMCLHAAHWRIGRRFLLIDVRLAVEAVAPAPCYPAYRWGVRRARLPLSGSCAPVWWRAITHAAVAALATLGRAVGSFVFGYRAVLRARPHAVSRWCSRPAFARMRVSPNDRPIPTFFVGYRHRKIKITLAAVCDWGCLPPSRSPRVFFMVLFGLRLVLYHWLKKRG